MTDHIERLRGYVDGLLLLNDADPVAADVSALLAERDSLAAENVKLRALVDESEDIVKFFDLEAPETNGVMRIQHKTKAREWETLHIGDLWPFEAARALLSKIAQQKDGARHQPREPKHEG